ncbi:MAG: hypothetical protein ACYTDY_01685 [Planctomycetota bacterium]|jgi:hypothetical protein
MLRHSILLVCVALLAQRAPPRLQSIDDPLTERSDREVHDVTKVVFDVSEEHVGVAVHFRRPFSEMMFQSATVYVDCDDDAETGKEGAELRVRALAGSRFHPNSWKPDGRGVPPPLEQRRTTFAVVRVREQGVERRTSTIWTWKGMLEPPEVVGRVLTFRFPQKLIQNLGQRYNRHVPVRLEVLGSCSEHPVPLRHQAGDEGVDIRIDGQDGDWSGGTRADDPGEELHTDARALDIKRVQVEHSEGWLYVGVWLDRPGFGRDLFPDDDIEDLDRIVVAVEPLLGRYQEYREHVIRSTAPRNRGRNLRSAAGDRFVECAIGRAPEQTSFRVAVWSDALRKDRVPDEGSFRLDTAPWRDR